MKKLLIAAALIVLAGVANAQAGVSVDISIGGGYPYRPEPTYQPVVPYTPPAQVYVPAPAYTVPAPVYVVPRECYPRYTRYEHHRPMPRSRWEHGHGPADRRDGHRR